jgi:hypothetical protein
MRRFLNRKTLLAAALAPFAASSVFAETVDIGTEGADGPLSGLIDGMQSIMNFFTGPMAVFALAASLMVAVAMWMFAPKEGMMGSILRVIAGGILILNIPGWVVWLQSLST